MSIQEIRQRIEAISNGKVQNIAKFQLLTACRISEAVGKYAPTNKDLSFTEYKGNSLVLFTLKTAKREGIERTIALPRDSLWIEDLVEVYSKSKKLVFDYSPRSVERHYEEAFKGLTYPIERYSVKEGVKEEGGGKSKTILRHKKNVSCHALRHLRLSELTNHYGFDEIDLSIYAGWKIKGMAGRYVSGQWGRYIEKLLVVEKK